MGLSEAELSMDTAWQSKPCGCIALRQDVAGRPARCQRSLLQPWFPTCEGAPRPFLACPAPAPLHSTCCPAAGAIIRKSLAKGLRSWSLAVSQALDIMTQEVR